MNRPAKDEAAQLVLERYVDREKVRDLIKRLESPDSTEDAAHAFLAICDFFQAMAEKMVIDDTTGRYH
jgi:hypothetical protein